jgi:Carboxypeptidase regulatory-like domain/TonB dependent receptor
MKFTRVDTLKLAAASLLVLLLGGQLLLAQSSGTSALTGVITDPSGGAIPNVTITLTNNGTGQARTATTGQDGTYRFSLLQPGDYKVTFSATGFKTSEVVTTTLNVTETKTLDRTLEVGAQSEQITVESTVETLQTSSSTLGTVVESKQITELPLASRNYTQVLGLSAGANSGVNNGAAFGKGTLDMAVNGAGVDQNNFQMDGVSVMNAFGAGISADSGIYVGIAIPSPDAIAEFKVQTSTFDASYGRNPGANVNVVTKSGTNLFHGTLFEFFRNEDLNANSFFQNAENGGAKQILRQNQFGGTFGGPIKKDKLFFFGSYQGTRQLNGVAAGTSNTTLAPLPPGDRSNPAWQAALGAAMCPANHPSNPVPYQTALGILPNITEQVACDGSNINPIAMKILQSKNPNGSYYIPGSTNGGFQNVTYSFPAKYTGNQFISNVDYLINSKNTFAARYLFSEDPQVLPFGIGSVPGTPAFNYYANTNASAKLTTIVSANLINEVHAAMQRNIANGRDSTPQYTPQSVGITPIVPTQTQPPVMIIAGGPSIGGTLAPYVGPATQVQYGDQISWIHGKHTIRAGGEFEADQWNLSFASLLRGFLILPDFADFLIGVPTGNPVFGTFIECLFCVRSGPNGIIHAYREKDVSAFVQDDWKVSSKLTLNLGLRWEFDGMLGDKYGNLTNVWPSLLQSVPNPPTTSQPTGASLVGYVVPCNFASHYGAPPAGVKTVSGCSPTEGGIPWNNFGPRFGFAYQARPKLVVRGGFGMFYDRVGSSKFVHAVEQGDPYALTLDYSGSAALQYTLANPFPSTPLGFSPRFFDPATGDNSQLNTPFYSHVHTPLTRQYNLTFQYEFLDKWVLEAGFVGSSSINQANYNHNYNLAQLASPSNPINGVTTNTIANAIYRVPYLGYQEAGLQGTGYDAYANYNSLQVTVRKQFSHGLTFQGAYTWSKDLTVLSFDGQTNVNNASNEAQQYGPAGFSRPQRFVINYSYVLPGDNVKGALGWVTRGWLVSGVTVVQGGTPMSFYNTAGGTAYYGGANAGTGEGGSSTAQLAPGVTYGQIAVGGSPQSHSIYTNGQLAGLQYFNPNAFAPPPIIGSDGIATGFGNSGQGIVLGPGQFNFDASLTKTMRIKERHTLQFRAEFFNLFNHPMFANPITTQNTTATFGLITATATNPRLIQFALKYQF